MSKKEDDQLRKLVKHIGSCKPSALPQNPKMDPSKKDLSQKYIYSQRCHDGHSLAECKFICPFS